MSGRVEWKVPMRPVRLDPETAELLDRCLANAEHAAAAFGGAGDEETRKRFASALIEATSLGERDETRLTEFALSVLPAYRERTRR